MIVRDNEDTIEACLDSIYPWVDEIVVVDTGSVDRTPEICRRFGARMFEFPWCDDFSAARNESLKHARGDWIFWMDSDDTIDQMQGRRLRDLIHGPHADDCLGYVMQVHCPAAEAGQMTIVDHVKVFRNQPELRFEHRIHEQILPAIRRAGGDVSFTDIHVVHSGSRQTPDVRQRKLERDFRILELDLQERPDHPFVLFNLGMTCEDAEQYEEAEAHLRNCLRVSSPEESHVRKVWALLVNCLKHLDRGEEAVESATQALAQFPGDKELLFRRATLYQDNEQFEEAIADYERVLTESTDKVFQSIDPSICGYKAHHNLALALQAAGRSHVANHHWRQALSEYPLFAPAWVSLARSYAALNELNQLEEMLGQMPGDESLAVARAVSQALLHERRNEILPAQRILEAAWTASGDPACLDELARVLIESGHVRNAVHPLRQLAEIQPGNPSVFCNLGHALHVTGQAVEAIRAFRRSLELRPESSSTSRQLVQVLIEESDYERASEVLEAALRFDPHNEGLITIHRHLASCTQT